MARLRTFVAVELSSDVARVAAALIKRLQATAVKATWTKPHQFHLTLKFLGDIEERWLPDICRQLDDVGRRSPAFTAAFGGLGAFPNTDRPRTIWYGIREGLDDLQLLHATLDAALAKIGFAKERRRFAPHLTLGRIRGYDQGIDALRELLLAEREHAGGVSSIEELVLFSSELQPAGALHDALHHAELKA